MRGTPLRIAAFVAGLASAFALALGVGRWVGPLDVTVEAGSHGGSHAAADEPAAATGLTAGQGGHTLRVLDQRVEAGQDVTLRLRIDGPDGRPVSRFETVHEKELHLVVVRRDLTGFQHVHPELDPSTGVWTTPLDLSAGAWRVVADFAPAGGDGLVLAEDLFVSGEFTPADAPAERRTDTVDGYRVTLAGAAEPGEASTLTLQVTQDGRPVTDLQPYLGAYGHLVALRAGDLGYLHVHPHEGRPGPEIEFSTGFPTAGTYALFGDFRHAGAVHTAEFVVQVGDPGVTGETGETRQTGEPAERRQHEEEDDHDH